MIHIRNPLDSQFASSYVALTIGNFDGVHLGHQQLLNTLKAKADENQLLSAVMTFYPHPMQVLHPEKKIERMFDQRDLVEVLNDLGIHYLFEQNFNSEFARLEPEVFLREMLVKKMQVKQLIVGYDFAFGHDRSGDLSVLKSLCQALSVGLTVVPAYEKDEFRVSSTVIRQKLKSGEVEISAHLLGRPFYYRGVIQKGFQRGRILGVPTANLFPDVSFVPRQGVYVTQSYLQGHCFKGITNVGVNPTVSDEQKIRVETHLFDFNQDVYGQEMRVEFLKFLRDEKKFSGLDELKEQIHRDIVEAKDFFRG